MHNESHGPWSNANSFLGELHLIKKVDGRKKIVSVKLFVLNIVSNYALVIASKEILSDIKF